MTDAESSGLFIEVATVGSWQVVSIAGELDMHSVTPLRDRLEEIGNGTEPKVALNLSNVPFMDSSSLGILIVAHKRLIERGGTFALIGVSGSPRKVLSITGVDHVIPMYADVSDLPQV